MKINFTKKEYRVLLEMLYISDWVISSHVTEIDPNKDHGALRKKILSHYKEMGAADIVEYNKDHDEYYEMVDLEDHMQEEFLDPYNYSFFWDELIDSLARRDFIKEVGSVKYSQMEPLERATGTDKYKSLYANNFEEFGLKNLHLISENDTKV